MNECKRLSDCPADRLAHCRGEAVPPAGDVEVQRWEPENTIVGYNMKPVFDGSFVLHDHYSRDVTRLTAERDGLENALDACDGDRHRLLDKNTYLQSELTKARELMAEASAWIKANTFGGCDAAELWERLDAAHNVDESCGQDAEAAKGGHCSTCSKLNGSSYCDCAQE
jgi:hypothetical protein